MDKFQEYNALIAEIFQRNVGDKMAEKTLQQQEFDARVSVFLGNTYNQEDMERVQRLEKCLFEGHNRLCAELEDGKIGPEHFVDAVNQLAHHVYTEIEKVLGSKDFERLYHASLADTENLIDKGQFLESYITEPQPNPKTL